MNISRTIKITSRTFPGFPRPYEAPSCEAEDSLAGAALEGAVALVAHVAVGRPLGGALAVADEVQDDLHLLVEAQGFDLDDLRLAVRRTLLGLDGNLEGNLEGSQRRVWSLKKIHKRGREKVRV